jgi:hypothetical protein
MHTDHIVGDLDDASAGRVEQVMLHQHTANRGLLCHGQG